MKKLMVMVTVAAAAVGHVAPAGIVHAGRVRTVQANGSVVRTWSPGRYEARTVMVQ